jgi:serine-type D-Ala-D-Ala carboxypeptidase (penicillin-binding protein 5/6)
MRRLLLTIAAVPLFAGAAQGTLPVYESAAPVAYMVDLSSGKVLYARNADRPMPPASMAKMMTTHLAFRLIQQGKIKLTDSFVVRPETWQKWHGPAAGSTMFLSPGERVSVANLLHGIVTLSGNDACIVLAEGIAGTEQAFTGLMNEEARRLGLSGSHFGTSNGWPDNGATKVTARDLARLAQATLEESPTLYRQFYGTRSFTWGKTMAGTAIRQDNRNPILGRIAGADGLKTGHTQEAGYGFTGSAEQNGRRLVMVVAGLPSFNSRIEESVRFMDWGFKSWRSRPLFAANARVADAKVQGGTLRTIPLVAPRALAATLPLTAGNGLAAKVVYDGPLKAPIAKGQIVARLVVDAGEAGLQSLPLAAGEAVAEAGFFGRLWNGLMALLGM